MASDITPELSPNALLTLKARYLRRDEAGQVIETPADMFHRVARFVAGAETAWGADAGEVDRLAGDFYEAMARGRFLPNSPTMMNAGRAPAMLSACFVLPIDDSVEGIFDSVKHAAQIQKVGGGTGFSFDRLRPTGDYIASSGGRTSGPISFWRVFSEATRAIQQGAFRRGANMGMMSLEHPDVLKFIAAKSDQQAFENFNVSVKVTDAFMQALDAGGDEPHVVINPRTARRYWLPADLDVWRYELGDLVPVRPGDPPAGLLTRRQLWQRVVQAAWASGEPGVCFIDRVNRDNPTPELGSIQATNPCGEQPLLDYEACNLGSLNLSAFVAGGRLDEGDFRQAVAMAVRFLDDVIEVNDYVIPQIEAICRGNRKIGLGVMGLADAMFMLGIKYDSEQAIDFAGRVARLLTESAFAASEALARRRGCFPNHPASTWARRGRAMRNAAVTTVAPTGTLSILAGCTGGIEPAFALAFYRQILGGQRLLEVNEAFRRRAVADGFWDERLGLRLAAGEHLRQQGGVSQQARELLVTAHDVAGAWHVRMQAAFQEHIDGAISKTINLPAEASVGDVDDVYRLAHRLGCKGVTVYRTGCRADQPMATIQPGVHCPQCGQPLTEESGCTRCRNCGAPLCSL